MDAVLHTPDADETELRLKINKVIRQAHSIFSRVQQDAAYKKALKDATHDTQYTQGDINKIEDSGENSGKSRDSSLKNQNTISEKVLQQDVLKYRQGNSRTLARDMMDTSSESQYTNSMHRAQYQGSVVAPHRCGIRKGEGDYVFIGKIRKIIENSLKN